MTIWKQRFFRWNYFFVSGIYWDMFYIIRNWKLGFWEIGAKLFVFQEVYETLLYLLAPFVLPISFYVRPLFSGYLYIATLALYQINVILFNYVSARSQACTEPMLPSSGLADVADTLAEHSTDQVLDTSAYAQ